MINNINAGNGGAYLNVGGYNNNPHVSPSLSNPANGMI